MAALFNSVKSRGVAILVAEFLAVFVLGIAFHWLLVGSPERKHEGDGATAVTADATQWTCSMHPQIRRNGSGDCPLCGMDLIPVTVTSGGIRTLTISPESRALMDIQTAPVERKYVTAKISAVGKVEYDETRLGHITAWVPGRLDRLYVDYTGIKVKKGDHMAYIYSPELYSAQEELIQALRFRSENPPSRFSSMIDLVAAAREKLRLLGLTEEQVKQIEKQKKPSDHLTTYAPLGGIVIEKLKQEGDYVKTGERIYTVADLSQVWVQLDVYESDLVWLRYGQKVVFSTEAYPGEKFVGKIAFIQPVLNDRTRTIKLRVNVENAEGKLTPEMFVRGMIHSKVAAGGRVMDPDLAGKWISPMHPEIVKDEPGNCDICGMPLVRAESLGYISADSDLLGAPLVIPVSAALVTGKRAIVYVASPSRDPRLDRAYDAAADAMKEKDVDAMRAALKSLEQAAGVTGDQPLTPMSTRIWAEITAELAEKAAEGKTVETAAAAQSVFNRVSETMDRLREQFASPDQPTFNGREIVLGPRAGDYYLVRHGLAEGELVVVHGNFKIDSEIQIQAKPSMMTPEGGGGGGHDHGDHGGKADSKGGSEGTSEGGKLPEMLLAQLQRLDIAHQMVKTSIETKDLTKVRAAFAGFGDILAAVKGRMFHDHASMVWKEFSMLLGNDAFEGQEADDLAHANKIVALLDRHMERLRDQLGLSRLGHGSHDAMPVIAPLAFQQQLGKVYLAYLPMQDALASDSFPKAQKLIAKLHAALISVDAGLLEGAAAAEAWTKERSNLAKVIGGMQAAKEIQSLRSDFSLLSDEVSVLAARFGFGEVGSVYQLECPMAFKGRGAIWLQC